MLRFFIFTLILLSANPLFAQTMNLPESERAKYYNPDGSCVQCSIGMVGVWNNNPSAATLLWNTEYGPAVRGGSSPSRVAAYCNSRKIPIYNVTGDTGPWIEYALRTGRGCAGTWDYAHMVTFYGMTPDGKYFAVCNNQFPRKITWHTREEFYRRHRVDGAWVVILKNQAPTPIPANTLAPTNIPKIHW